MKTVKTLCFIPVILLGLCLLSLGLASVLEFPLERSGLYLFFGIIGIGLLFFASIPSFCVSVVALIIAVRRKLKRFIGFAITDIVISILWLFLASMLFIGGMSV